MKTIWYVCKTCSNPFAGGKSSPQRCPPCAESWAQLLELRRREKRQLPWYLKTDKNKHKENTYGD